MRRQNARQQDGRGDMMKRMTQKMKQNKLTALAEVLVSIKSAKEMERFLRELLTDCELRDIVLRWELMRLLDQGMTQRKIAEDLQISLCKITRGSRILKDPDSVCTQMLRNQTK
jgi:TrpR family trp operon transcriptional repressor